MGRALACLDDLETIRQLHLEATPMSTRKYNDERRLDDHLLSLPIDNPERNKLRDVVKGTPEQLARKAHKYLTLADEYNARKNRHPLKFDGKGVYAKWLSLCGIKPADVRAIVAMPTHPTLTPIGDGFAGIDWAAQ